VLASAAFSCPFLTFPNFGASTRDEFDAFAAAAASHESSNSRANDAELTLMLEYPHLRRQQ
jgi:hypothetical protein